LEVVNALLLGKLGHGTHVYADRGQPRLSEWLLSGSTCAELNCRNWALSRLTARVDSRQAAYGPHTDWRLLAADRLKRTLGASAAKQLKCISLRTFQIGNCLRHLQTQRILLISTQISRANSI
jgi:hypothetical protein